MNKLDSTLSLIGILILSLLLVLMVSLHITQPIGLFITFLCTFVYYYSNREKLLRINSEDHGRPLPILARIPSLHIWITFIVAIIGSIVVLYSRDLLTRPLWLFILIAILPILILFEIIFKVYKFHGGETSILFQVIILLITIVLSGVITFPYNGGDTWAHLFNAHLISEKGSISAIEGSYKNYPLYPALISFLSMVLNLDDGMSARLISVLSMVGCSVFVFSLARKSFNSTQKALIAILILVGSKWFIYWGTLVVSMTISYFLFTAFYVLVSSRLIKPEKYQAVLLYLLAIVLPFFHPTGAVAIIIVCLVYWLLGITLFRKPDETRTESNITIFLVVFTVVVTLTQWIYYGKTLDFAIKSLISAIFQDTPNSIGLARSESDILSYTFDNINFYFLLSLSSIEILRQIRIKNDQISLFSGICGFIFVGFAYATQLINLQAVLPYRWLLFGSILLVIPATNTFANILKSRTVIVKALAVLIFIPLFILAYSNKDTNRDNPFYGVLFTERFEITDSEYAGVKYIRESNEILPGSLRVDFRLWEYLKFYLDGQKLQFWDTIDLKSDDIIFSIRDVYYSHKSAFFGDSIDNLNVKTPYLNLIFDAGDIKWFDWHPN